MDNKRIEIIFGEGGPLSERLPSFQPREAQVSMAIAVSQALEGSADLLVEAGTGVGKSQAYLIPLIERALETGEPALVSTHTLSLQQQLMDKDIPLAIAVLGKPVKVVRAMGRSNYFCELRFSLINPHGGAPALPGIDAGPMKKIYDWSREEEETIQDNLPFKLPAGLWEKIHVDAYGCPGHKCPHARECWFMKERAEMANADIVLANHALVLSDLNARRQGSAVLPDTAMAVLDEAHHLESLASEHLGLRMGRKLLTYQLTTLDSKGHGLLARSDAPEELRKAHEDARFETAEFFSEMDKLMTGRRDSLEIIDMLVVDTNLPHALTRLASGLQEHRQTLDDEALAGELGSLAARLRQAGEAIAGWLTQDLGDGVYWLESQEREGGALLRSAPLDVGETLAKELYSRFRATVLTSATLSTGGDFSYIQRGLGLEKAITLSLPSPFNYAENVSLHLSRGMPDPRHDSWLDKLCDALPIVLGESEGRAFVLFTNYHHLEECGKRLQPWIEEQGWEFLAQTKGKNRDTLIKKFRRGGAVLFGTASFWEGVDVPGDALSSVVITKLPFKVPDTPLEKARKRRVEAAGGNYFMDLSLPEAVLKLKQGFGRLIRHEDDKGWFFLLDSRAVRQGYGKKFVRALPTCRTFIDGEEQSPVD